MQQIQETRVRSLDWEDPLEEEMAIHSSILAWKISWTEEPGGLQSPKSTLWGHKELDTADHRGGDLLFSKGYKFIKNVDNNINGFVPKTRVHAIFVNI